MNGRSKFLRFLRFSFLIVLFTACSEDDDTLSGEDFFNADIEGETFEVNGFSGSLTGEKRLSVIGTVDLALKAENAEGKIIEFMILNYNGKNTYSIGQGLYNENWIKYSQTSPEGSWGADKLSGSTPDKFNSIIINNDDGQTAKGTFFFEGRENQSKTRKMVTNGDFSFKYKN